MAAGTAEHQQAVRQWLLRNPSGLQVDRATVACPRPGVVSARTTDGDLVTIEVLVYRRGTW
jgi:hypothetical protein